MPKKSRLSIADQTAAIAALERRVKKLEEIIFSSASHFRRVAAQLEPPANRDSAGDSLASFPSQLTLMTASQCAKAVGCHVDKIYRMVQAGQIKGVRFGRATIRVTREELERFVHKGLREAGP